MDKRYELVTSTADNLFDFWANNGFLAAFERKKIFSKSVFPGYSNLQSQPMNIYARHLIPFALSCELEGEVTKEDIIKMKVQLNSFEYEQYWGLKFFIWFPLILSFGFIGSAVKEPSVGGIACCLPMMFLIYPTIALSIHIAKSFEVLTSFDSYEAYKSCLDEYTQWDT